MLDNNVPSAAIISTGENDSSSAWPSKSVCCSNQETEETVSIMHAMIPKTTCVYIYTEYIWSSLSEDVIKLSPTRLRRLNT